MVLSAVFAVNQITAFYCCALCKTFFSIVFFSVTVLKWVPYLKSLFNNLEGVSVLKGVGAL